MLQHQATVKLPLQHWSMVSMKQTRLHCCSRQAATRATDDSGRALWQEFATVGCHLHCPFDCQSFKVAAEVGLLGHRCRSSDASFAVVLQLPCRA